MTLPARFRHKYSPRLVWRLGRPLRPSRRHSGTNLVASKQARHCERLRQKNYRPLSESGGAPHEGALWVRIVEHFKQGRRRGFGANAVRAQRGETKGAKSSIKIVQRTIQHFW